MNKQRDPGVRDELSHRHHVDQRMTTADSPYKICRCGAVRRVRPRGDKWHVCALCQP